MLLAGGALAATACGGATAAQPDADSDATSDATGPDATSNTGDDVSLSVGIGCCNADPGPCCSMVCSGGVSPDASSYVTCEQGYKECEAVNGSYAMLSDGTFGCATPSGARVGRGDAQAAALDAGISDASNSLDPLADVLVPDAFPTSCSEVTFQLTPDASPGECEFTPADVSCNANADCGWIVTVGCENCVSLVYGVNKTSTARCVPPPCPPPIGPIVDCDATGLYTQDCQLISGARDLHAACVNHQCLSFSTASSP